MRSARPLILAGFVLMLAAIAAAAEEDAPSVAKQLELLKSDDAKVRYHAVLALRTMGPHAKKALGALIETLGDKSSSMRLAAASALGNIGPPAAGATGALVAALKDEKYYVRRSAAAALAKIGPGAAKAVGALTEALRDANILVRRFAAARDPRGAVRRRDNVASPESCSCRGDTPTGTSCPAPQPDVPSPEFGRDG